MNINFFASSQVCLVHDPRVSHPYGQLYTVEYLGNIVGGQKTLYNNQQIRVLKQAVYDSISNDEVKKGKLSFFVSKIFINRLFGLVLILVNICMLNMVFLI